MTSRDFCYWLQGYIEISASKKGIDASQLDKVKKHLALVFKHEIDPSFGGPAVQETLSAIHGGGNNTLLRC